MGQYFHIVNLDNCSPDGVDIAPINGKFGEHFAGLDDPRLMNALWIPEPGHKHITAAPYSQLSTEPLKVRHSPERIRRYPKRSLANETGEGLPQLPNEIIDHIYQNFHHLIYILRFAATCQRYYDIGRSHIETFMSATFIDSWAGNRIICLGDYAYMNDLPSGMVTDAERELIKKQFNGDEDEDEDEDEEGSDEDEEYYSIYDRLCFLQQLDPLWDIRRKSAPYRALTYDGRLSTFFSELGGHYRHREEKAHMDLDTAYVLRDLISISAITLPGTDIKKLYSGAYVLRNLTSKEFIRGDAIRDLWKKYRFMRHTRFNHVLIIRITWSSDPSLSFEYEGPIQIHRGKWAGHRFDLSEVTSVRNEEGVLEGWKDVSWEVLNELITIHGGHVRDE
ncbi:hypothetical protein DXG03_004152 [Asterophora parasitica]|uniref:F-box domain-containing protein n=1 Tax=Asterophora parasitica TaxID=117018 RepID=A0A9P7G2X1_9AGAR|nr:hypothetical protein DXG03_004152 [Asterophora parasitica]